MVLRFCSFFCFFGLAIVEKPEVRKAGGVYYTPRFVVEYIIENSVGVFLKKIFEEAKGLPLKVFQAMTESVKILDPASGSGSFLIKAYEKILEHWERRLKDDFTTLAAEEKDLWLKKHRSIVWRDDDTNDLHLTVDFKRRILLNNIFGVDIDSSAVEVTQLSLYLKMLENETRTSLIKERDFLTESVPLLPELKDNIKCGNSLISPDFSIAPEDLGRVLSFEWKTHFSQIFKKGGFSLIIGNPPYCLLQPQNTNSEELAYYKDRYKVAQYKLDIFHLFIERSLLLLKEGGLLSFITPGTFITNNYTINLRRFILENAKINYLMTIPDGVFEDASVDNAVFCLTKTSNASLRALHDLLFIEGMTSGFSLRERQRFNVQQSFFENNEGLIFRPALTNEFTGLEASFLKSSSFLGDIARVNFGMQLRHRKKYPGDVISGEPARSAKDYRPCLTGKRIQTFNTLYGSRYSRQS